MIIYVEKSVIDNPQTKKILSFYKNSIVLEVDNYKNIFDKNIPWKTVKSLIIAKVNNCLLEAPFWYGHNSFWFFIKNSLNCIYDCSYCYLKWSFKNDIPVIFVNYDDIKNQILKKIDSVRTNQDIWFYSSDYSDNLAIDDLTDFSKEFVPFFDSLKNAKMEIRTKSANIKNLLSLKPSKNVEIAFSLNPSEVINLHEKNTTSLEKRIESINKLIDNWWQVWIRFIPLLEVDNYKEIYKRFLLDLKDNIDFSKVYSVFIGGLLYTSKDYNNMLKKEAYLDLLYKLSKSKDWFYRENIEVRNFFYELFDSLLPKTCNRCLENL